MANFAWLITDVAWGKRRNLNGTALTNAFVTPAERHAFDLT
jgi:hypothetical protein